MAQIDRSGADRRSQSLSDVEALVATRSETLTLYSGLAAHRPFSENDEFETELKQFCEALIDYTASAHFQLYQHLAENKERRHAMLTVADGAYPKIAETTDYILDFNDSYGDQDNVRKKIDRVEQDLSMLGEVLADRIQYEDEVIAALRSQRRAG